MDDPVNEIVGVIRTLCSSPPHTQHAALSKYFTKNASFVHPIARVDSFANSRWYIGEIYLWYKILTPRVDINTFSVAYDKENQVIYAASQQYFKVWLLPAIRPRLLTVLYLTTDIDDDYNAIAPNAVSHSNANATGPKKYYIKKQLDMYQPNELARYFGFGFLSAIVSLFQIWATILCVIGATLGFPIISLEESQAKSITKNTGY